MSRLELDNRAARQVWERENDGALDGADQVRVTVDPLDVAVKLVGVPGTPVGVGVVSAT